MKSILNKCLIFAGGVVIGASIGWACGKRHGEKSADEENEKSKEFYRNLINERCVQMDISSDDYNEYSSEVPEESYTEKMNRMKSELHTSYLNEPVRVRYDRISNKGEEEEVDGVSLKINNDQPQKDIFIITAEQFAKERLGYDKVTLYWWEKNLLLTTEDYDILDVPALIGTEWRERIGEYEPDLVYVRNVTANADYEIFAQHESYYDSKEE